MITIYTPKHSYNPPALPDPTVLFATNFTGCTHENFSQDYRRSNITGTDPTTGQVWPGYSPNHPNVGPLAGPLGIVRSFFDYSPEYNGDNLITTSNVSDYIACAFADEIGPDGTNEKILTINLKIARGDPAGAPAEYGGGCVLRLQRMFQNTSPLPAEIPNLYQCGYFKLQPNLISLLASNKIHTIAEQKAGGLLGTDDGGDFRLRIGVQKINNLLYLMADTDQNANAEGAVTVDPDGYFFDETTNGSRIWSLYDTKTPVTVDSWHKLEFFYHRDPKHGFFAIALDGVLIAQHTGRTIGKYNLPVGRISLCSVYTGTSNGTGTNKFARQRIMDFPDSASPLYAAVREYFFRYPQFLPD